MLRSMYSGVSGMRGFQTKLDVIGNNIANVNTVGFKGGRVMFSDVLSQTTAGVTGAVQGETAGVNAKQIGLGVSVASIDTMHTPGSAMTTNNPRDFRIDGDGFFVVSQGDGAPQFFTRAGNFTVDAARQLVTNEGMFVLEAGGGLIEIPEDVVSFSVGQDGWIRGITGEDEVVEIAQIGLVKVVNPSGLLKVGSNMYQITPNANPDGAFDIVTANDPDLGTGAIISGQLEMSNVDLTAEFTEMIVAQRGFQANSRIITTSDEILQEVVNLKR
ncbi:flagellar basal body rod protein FlgG [Paenibacillus sp. NPDC058071]|uniref:flagellar basal body rod protein FlgG n=1 Tax=Paenibacillus sp. NPDC058071 TaxID=3346326 RepID=UPI0036D9E271